MNNQFKIQTDDIDDLTTVHKTYSIEMTGTTQIADTNPVITGTVSVELIVENGCDLDVLSQVGSLDDSYVYYIGIQTDNSYTFPPINSPESKTWTAEWSNSVPGCPIDFKVQILDSATGNYRDLNVVE